MNYSGILDIDFVERGRNVVSCSRDGTAKLWDVSTQKCLHTYQSDSGGAEVNACTLHKTDAVDNLTTSPDEGKLQKLQEYIYKYVKRKEICVSPLKRGLKFRYKFQAWLGGNRENGIPFSR